MYLYIFDNVLPYITFIQPLAQKRAILTFQFKKYMGFTSPSKNPSHMLIYYFVIMLHTRQMTKRETESLKDLD